MAGQSKCGVEFCIIQASIQNKIQPSKHVDKLMQKIEPLINLNTEDLYEQTEPAKNASCDSERLCN